MKKYCCYCFPIKKNTRLNSCIEYVSPSTKTDINIINDSSINPASLISFTENPLNNSNSNSNNNRNSNSNNDSIETVVSIDLNSSIDSNDSTVKLYTNTWRFTNE